MADLLVVAPSETLALRLRLMIEAEGGQARVVASAAEARWEIERVPPTAVVVAGADADLPWAGDLPVVIADDDWGALRRRIAALVGDGEGEADWLAAALARASLLLVDDSVTYREFLRHELERAGVRVTVCASGDAAEDLMRERRFDVVMMDLVMPGMGGLELCRRLASWRRSTRADCLLVVLSSREGRDDLLRSLEVGADMFMVKSQEVPLLRARLGAALRRKFLTETRPAQ